MMRLASLQEGFVLAVFSKQGQDEHAILKRIEPSGGLDSQQRIGIYRNAILSSFSRVLEEVYPVIAHLLGETFFRAMAGVCAEQTPSTQPDLNEYGKQFPAFLEHPCVTWERR